MTTAWSQWQQQTKSSDWWCWWIQVVTFLKMSKILCAPTVVHCRDDAAVWKLRAKGEKTAEDKTPQAQRNEAWLSHEPGRALAFAECDAGRVTTEMESRQNWLQHKQSQGLTKPVWSATRGRHASAKPRRAREQACVGIFETTQLLSSVPVGERCREKGADEDALSIISITLARFVAHLAISLASKKIGGFGEGVLRTTVALGETECCILRLPEGQDQLNIRKPKLDQREGNERHTQDSDVRPANDQHTTVHRRWENNIVLATSSQTPQSTANIPRCQHCFCVLPPCLPSWAGFAVHHCAGAKAIWPWALPTWGAALRNEIATKEYRWGWEPWHRANTSTSSKRERNSSLTLIDSAIARDSSIMVSFAYGSSTVAKHAKIPLFKSQVWGRLRTRRNCRTQ